MVIGAGALFLLMLGPAAGEPVEGRISFDEFRAQLELEIEAGLRKYRVPGASLALLDGDRIEVRGFGLLHLEEPGAVDASSAFQVASVSKPVAATGILQLAEAGVLDLDVPVSGYLRRWQFPADGLESESVTARRLLSHTAGVSIHGYPGLEPDLPLPSLVDSLNGASGGAGPVFLQFPAEQASNYSSGGYTVLQLLVEELTGEPFDGYMARSVLRPLRMLESGYDPPPEKRRATGHGWWGRPLPLYRFRAQAASGLYSTARDLARFLAGLARPAGLRLSPGLRDQMLEPQAGRRRGFGLGFEIEEAGGRRIALHTGANRGFRSILAADLESGLGLVLLTNSDRGRAMTTDALCSWGKWVTGGELPSCWAARKSRGTILAIALILGVGLLMDGTGFVARFGRRRGSVRRPGAVRSLGIDRYRWLSWLRLVLSVLALSSWWIFWYTDFVALRKDGIEHFIPVAPLPPTFFWLTLIVTLWCLLSMTRSIVSQMQWQGARA